MCLHCLGNFAKVRKVMMATTATMIVLNVVISLLFKILYLAAGTDSTDRGVSPILAFLDLVDLAVWVTYLVYMSGVLNRLPNGKGYKVLGAELGRIACGRIAWWFAILSFLEGDWGSSGESVELSIAALNLIVFAYVFFVFKKSEVKDPQELLTACQGCPCTPLPISPGPAQPQGQVVVH